MSGRSGPRLTSATLLAAAVLGTLITAPHAQAAPPGPDPTRASAPERKADARKPSVWPRPQTLRAAGERVPLGDEATLIADADAGPYALDALREVLRGAGVRTVRDGRPGESGRGLVVRAGGPGARKALHALKAPARGDLPSGGYRLATGRADGRPTVAMEGVGPDGLFHAVQTLRQLIRNGATAAAVVRDWPGTKVRGTAEAFYGDPWSHEQRLAQLEFMGRTKQNRYLYAPGDDPYRHMRWREPYPAGQREEFRDLADRARRSHVTLAWAVAPGQSLCFSSAKDLRALRHKVDAMWTLGVRAFHLQFQDVSYTEWHCDEDADVFGRGPAAAAKAQARVANAVARHLRSRHPGAAPVSVLPTEYYQEGRTDYRRALAAELESGIEVAWTGVGVVPRTITGPELVKAREVFEHPLVTMDNYPVNDFAQDRLFLGPSTGRDPAVATGSAAVLANAMAQPFASRIPLFTAADFAWNPRDYVPAESWAAAVDDLAGGDPRSRAGLRALAGNSSSSKLVEADGAPDTERESAYLRPLLAEFWQAEDTGRGGREATRKLRAAFQAMREAPGGFRSGPGTLRAEVAPWLRQLSRYGRAGERALDMLAAHGRKDGAAAERARREVERLRRETERAPVTVGKGVLDVFLKEALARAESRNDPKPQGARRATEFGRVRPLHAVTVLAEPGAGRVVVEARLPGQGWQRLGVVSDSGWTRVRGAGVRADAVRLSGAPEDTAGPRVRHVVPWFEDDPAVAARPAPAAGEVLRPLAALGRALRGAAPAAHSTTDRDAAAVEIGEGPWTSG